MIMEVWCSTANVRYNIHTSDMGMDIMNYTSDQKYGS